MALLRKLFYRKPPDGLFEISERVYVFDCCFTIDALEEKDYKNYVGGIVAQLREQYPDASILVFNFREGDRESPMANALSEYDMTIMEYPRQYEGVPVLLMEVIHHFLRSSESWLSLGLQNLLLMHCERGGWPVLAFMLAALLIYRKQYNVEYKTLDMVYKQAPRELLHMLSPINPIPSQLRYLQYISRRNVAAEWPPKERALTMDCIIIRTIPNFDGQGGCRPIFRLYGQDPLLVSDRAPKVLFSTPKKSRTVLHYKQGECELIKIDINCYVQGDIVMECISLDDGIDQEKIMFRVMFNTSFIRSNILMLGREEIDMLWEAKDRFSKDFRAEVLFSDMDVAASVLPMERSCFEEKEGLPEEAFAKVQEIFNSVDWLIPKGDAAVEVLQQMGLSSEVLETYSQSAKFHQENKSLEARRHSVEDISDLTSHNDPLSEKLSPNADLYMSQAQSQRSETGATVPIAKGESLPSVLYDFKGQNSGIAELGGPGTQKSVPDTSPSTFLIPTMNVDGFSPGQPLTPPLEEKTRVKSGLSPTSAPYAGKPISFDPPLEDEIVVNDGISSSATSYPIQAEETKDRPSQPMPSLTTSSTEDVVEDPITDSLIPLLTPPTAASAKKVNRVAPPPPPPPPPLPLSSSISTIEETECTRFNLPCPPSISPSLDSDTPASRGRGRSPPPTTPSPLSSHMTDPTSVTTTSKYSEFGKSFTRPSVEETSSITYAPTSIAEPPCSISPVKEDSPSSPIPLVTPPLVDRSARKPPAPPPPPPKMASALSSPPPTLSSKEPPAPGAVCQPELGPPLKELSGMKAAPPPPPPLPMSIKENSTKAAPPQPPPPPMSIMENSMKAAPPQPPPPPMSTKENSFPMDTKPAPPPPPPPPISSKENLSLGGGTPLPPSPPPLSGKGEVKASPSPPPPPPTPATHMGPAANGSPSPSPPPPLIPPPGAKGKPLLSRTITSKSNQGKKLKPLHWLKLSRAVSGSLWAEAQKPGEATKAPEIDLSELESLFSAAVPNADQGATGRKGGSRASVVNKVEKVQLIDLRRANNCEIMLSKVKVPLHDMLSSVLALEDNALDVDQVDNLIKFCPSKEEMELLKGYTGDRDKLGKCEQFFLELMKVPRIESKLRVFSFKIQFTAQVSDLKKNLTVVTSAADQIRGSAKLKRIMQTILSLGNALNQGTARGSAIGFRLDSLLKLTETRARNNRMTLMHYLCKVIADKIPEVLDFAQELSSLEPASKVQLKYLAEEMQSINKGLEKVMQELTLSENDGPVSDQFRKALKEFLSFCEGEVRSLASLYSGVGRNVDALILYFGEDPARCPFEQVISTLLNFTRMLKTAHEENRKQLELERKKAEKEASTEKLISGGAPEKMLDAR